MTTIRKLPQAQEDLLDIWCFIARDTTERADHYLDMIEGKLRVLATFPGMGRVWDGLQAGIRVFPIDDYLVFYRQAGASIELVRVLHGARDIASLFGDGDT